MSSIALVVGTRPEIIKMAPVINEAKIRDLQINVIHTGQHYSKEMSKQFFDSLSLPLPDINLDIQSENKSVQLGEMISKLGDEFRRIQPNIVLAVGDTNSVVAACLASIQNNIPFGHIEAGLRSYDNTMPEEINRKLVDSVSSLLFAPSQRAMINLLYEGLDPERIYLTGNTIVDSIRVYSENIFKRHTPKAKEILDEIEGEFIICTFHRVSNVDNRQNLKEISNVLLNYNLIPIIFLMHPRTEKQLKEFNLYKKLHENEKLHIYASIDYLSILRLIIDERCKIILTDSGGLQEEASFLKKPCITLRPNTERPETVESQINFLVRIDEKEIIHILNQTLKNKDFMKKIKEFGSPYGDGYASNKILDIIEERWDNIEFKSPELYNQGSKSFFLMEMKEDMERSVVENNFHCQVTMVYDEKGQPIPIPKVLKKGYKIRNIIKEN